MRKSASLCIFFLALAAPLVTRAMDLKEWTVTGDVTLDSSKAHTGGGASLKLGPGAKAVKTVQAKDASGTVTLWMFDDGAMPADPMAGHSGPCWGVINSKGQVLVGGYLYAKYLAGAKSFAGASGETGSKLYQSCQGIRTPRAPGWHKWTFKFEPNGFTLLFDDKEIPFNWNKTGILGFTGVVLLGDTADSKDPKAQTLWVDDVTATAGGQEVPPPPGVVPATDPAAPANPTGKIVTSVVGKHPRLLFNAERLEKLKVFYKSDAAKIYRDELETMLPKCVIPEDNKITHMADWGQVVGPQAMPTLALHYKLTGDKASLDRVVGFMKWIACNPEWTNGGVAAGPDKPETYEKAFAVMMALPADGERNSDTSASFTMVGAALAFDWLYDDLEPGFREQFRKILWNHARFMYYGGHLKGNPGGAYWHDVPMYNHRWFRDWGMTMAALATAENKPDQLWFLDCVHKEMAEMASVLPPDGSTHEGPGYGGSAAALGMALVCLDQCTGSKFFDVPYFQKVSDYCMQMSAPGWADSVFYADVFTHTSSIHPFYIAAATHFHEGNELDGLRKFVAARINNFGVGGFIWIPLLSDDPTLTGDMTKLPTTRLFPDLGLLVVRDSWDANGKLAFFKCGPPGGYNLNAWRADHLREKDGKKSLPAINVAHDHPDANTFALFSDGDYVAETDRYCTEPGKLSSSVNTILINGAGQTAGTRGEGDTWMQPSSDDMSKEGVITAYKDNGDVVVIEGEAAGAYSAKKTHPEPNRFRRVFAWVKNGYVLVFDDVRSPQPVDITWLCQGEKLETQKDGQYLLSKVHSVTKKSTSCQFQLLSDGQMTTKMGQSTANDHKKLLGWQQLQATVHGSSARFVSVFDLFHRGELKVSFTPSGADVATIIVTGPGINDTWQWTAATGKFDASTIHAVRKGGFDVTISPQTAAPPPVATPTNYSAKTAPQ